MHPENVVKYRMSVGNVITFKIASDKVYILCNKQLHQYQHVTQLLAALLGITAVRHVQQLILMKLNYNIACIVSSHCSNVHTVSISNKC